MRLNDKKQQSMDMGIVVLIVFFVSCYVIVVFPLLGTRFTFAHIWSKAKGSFPIGGDKILT